MEQIDTSVRANSQLFTQPPTLTQVSHGPAIGKDAERLQYQEMAQDFMNQAEMMQKMRHMTTSSQKTPRLNVSVDEVRRFNPRLSDFIVKDPLGALKMFQDHLNQAMKSMRDDSKTASSGEKVAAQQDNFPKKSTIYYVNFEGNFGRNHVTPRGLRSNLLNQFVEVSGIVTKMSLVRQRIETSVHYCEESKRGHVKHYTDNKNLEQLARAHAHEDLCTEDNNGFLVADAQGRPLSTEYGYCVYRDYQEIVLQEMPERTPTGQLPRSVRVILENDLVDKTKPGDRVHITGVYRANLNTNQTHSAIVENFIIATGV